MTTRYRSLGRTDLSVSEVSFGAHLSQVNILDKERRFRQIEAALENGINLFDVYDHGGYRQWEPMSVWLRPVRDRVLISLCAVWDPEKVLEEVDYALNVFRTDHIDLYRYLISGNSEQDEMRLSALLKAKAAGKIRAVGAVCHVPSQTLKALRKHRHELEFFMVPASFCFPSALSAKTAIGRLLMDLGIGIIAMKPFAGHTGDGPGHLFELAAALPELQALVRNGLTLGRIGIKALLQYPSVSTVMPTMNDTEEVLENVRASEAGKLTEEEVHRDLPQGGFL